jgi:hypothetical protein
MAPKPTRGETNMDRWLRLAAGLAAPVSRGASRTVLWLLFGGVTAEVIFRLATNERSGCAEEWSL